MIGLFALAMLGMIAAMAFGALMLLVAVGKALFWVLFLPIRLALGLLFLPFALLRFALKLTVGLVLLPLAAIAVVLGVGLAAFLGLVLVLVPLIPLLLLGLLIWGIVRISTRQTVAVLR